MLKSMVLLLDGKYPQHGLMNVCMQKAISINELAQAISNFVDKGYPIEHIKGRTGDIQSSIGDNSKLKSTLAISEFMSLSDGLDRLFE